MMLPILISVSVAPISYFFWARAPVLAATNTIMVADSVCNRSRKPGMMDLLRSAASVRSDKLVGGCLRLHEQKARYHGYFCVGAAILADDDQSCAAISHTQDDGLALPCLDWFHSDDEKFTDRLVKILKPQLRSHLCCRKSKT